MHKARPSSKEHNIAVLMCSYNGEHYIEEQIESIFNQTQCSVTLYIRDDGSTDNTPGIIKKIAESHDIKFINGTSNLGPKRAFLNLIQQAPDHHDYYALADQDDKWLPDKLHHAIDQLKDTLDSPSLYCSALTLTDESLTPYKNHSINIRNTTVQTAIFQNICTGNTAVFNKSSLRLLREKPPQFVIMHDWWIYLKISAHNGTIVYDNSSHILYRQHKNNVVGIKGVKELLYSYTEELLSGSTISNCLLQAESLVDSIDQQDKKANKQLHLFLTSDRSIYSRVKFLFTFRPHAQNLARTILLYTSLLIHSQKTATPQKPL